MTRSIPLVDHLEYSRNTIDMPRVSQTDILLIFRLGILHITYQNTIDMTVVIWLEYYWYCFDIPTRNTTRNILVRISKYSVRKYYWYSMTDYHWLLAEYYSYCMIFRLIFRVEYPVVHVVYLCHHWRCSALSKYSAQWRFRCSPYFSVRAPLSFRDSERCL